jgi:transcriptional regulator with XRE-family HTH domain
MPRDPGEDLSQRLRALREERWPDHPITQAQLAKALSGDRSASSPLISAWENGTKTPPASRIEAYATFFATRRSIAEGEPRLLREDELTDDERMVRDRLLHELKALRPIAGGAAALATPVQPLPQPVPMVNSPTWTFADGNTVTIVCAPLSEEFQRRMPYADPQAPDYIELHRYADADALVELHGHIRAVNPLVQVHFKLSTDLVGDDYTTHLVVLGGVDWNNLLAEVQDVLGDLLPVHQVSKNPDNAAEWDAWFESITGSDRKEYRARVEEMQGRSVLREDVAYFYRGPNPFNAKRTLTICNGSYGRGVYGAVRALTDVRFRDRNEEYLTTRFKDEPAFSILMRIRILQGKVMTPDWNRDFTRLHEWPEEPQ